MFKNLKIKHQLLFYFLLVIISLYLIFFFITYFYFLNIFEKNFLASQERILDSEKNKIESFLSDFEKDVLFLSKLASVKELLNVKSETEKERLVSRVGSNFLNFSQTKKGIYYQVRYLDENGDEIIRVDSDKENFKIIAKEDLQNKKGRYYFDDAMKLNYNEVFISPLDLNMENNEIEVPYKPVIRYATPVFNDEGNRKGIIITNVFADYFLENIRNLEEGKTLLINKDGYYLHYQGKDEKEWGFMFLNQNTFQNDFPFFADIIENKYDINYYNIKNNIYVTYKHIFPAIGLKSSIGSSQYFSDVTFDLDSEDYYWVLVRIADKNIVLREFYIFLFYFILFLIVSVLFLFSFVSLYIKKITIPIINLTEMSKKISQGNFDFKIELKEKNELYDLAENFNKMSDEIKKYREDMEKKIKERTDNLEKLNKFMVGRELKIIELKEELNKKNDKSKNNKK